MFPSCKDTLIGRRDRAILLIGFAATLRRSKLAALKVSDLERHADGILLHIGRSKTDQQGAGTQIPFPRGVPLKPVDALDTWLAAAVFIQIVARQVRQLVRSCVGRTAMADDDVSAKAIGELVLRELLAVRGELAAIRAAQADLAKALL